MQLSRRDLLLQLAKGTVGAGAVVLGRQHDLGFDVFGALARPGRAGGSPSLPKLPAVGTTASQGGAQVFRSRPDLHPPVVTIDVAPHDLTPGLVLTDSHAGPAHQGPMIITTNGDLVWFLDLSPGSDTALRAFNFQAQSLVGKPVLTWFQGAVVNGHGQGHYELWDSSYKKVAEVTGKNGYQADLHEFVLTSTGTALFTCYGEAPADLRPYGGTRHGSYFYGVVQEVDVRTGKLLFEWKSNDHVGLEESYEPVSVGTVPWDYFHVNSIDVDPTDGNFIISGRNTWTVYKVDRASGKMLWRLGGRKSNFKVESGAQFAFQHDVRRYPDGSVSMFDNEGGPPAEASQSRGLLLSVDEKSGQVALLRAYYHSPPVLSEALGSVQTLSDGGIFMGWGESSYFTQYAANGKVLLDGHLTEQTESYRAFRQVWPGRPTAEAPALAVVAGSSTATLYASYNGCTELARWVLFGGHARDRLAALGYAESKGFETAITVHKPPAYLAVQAVADGGEVLASSAPQHVG